MRWIHHDPDDRVEAAERARMLGLIDSWWREFARRADDIDGHVRGRARWDLPVWMAQHLRAIDGRLAWEFGRALREPGHRLVITPESDHHLRPLVGAILARAPRMGGWEFYDSRPPEVDATWAEAAVKGRSGGTLEGMLVSARANRARRIDLAFRVPSRRFYQGTAALRDAFVATEVLLGERFLDHWIGDIAVMGKRDAAARGARPWGELAREAEARRREIRASLAPRPPGEPDADGRSPIGKIYKLQPRAASDWPGRADLMVQNAPREREAFAEAVLLGDRSPGERFARPGQTLCYLKIDGSAGLDEEKFPDRGAIEDAILDLLGPEEEIAGAGTGLRYSYIDLALVDLPRAVGEIRRVLRAGNIPRRSWLLFFDAELEAEWIGIGEEAPEPPLRAEVR